MLDFFFPKKCAGCSQNLESSESSICALCSTHFQIAIRHDCSVCSRDLSSCLLCQNSCSPKILAAFEPSASVKRLLKKSCLLSGWHLHESLANAMWLKLLTKADPLFDEVLPISEPFWGSWKSSQVNKYLAKFFLKQNKGLAPRRGVIDTSL